MTDLFDQGNQPAPQTPAEPTTPAAAPAQAPAPDYNDLLSKFTDAHGNQKFKTVEDLVKGYENATGFIDTLKAEKDAEAAEKAKLASELESRKSLEDLLATRPNTDPVTEQPAPAQPSMTPEDVLAIVQQKELQEAQNTNVNSVKEAFDKKFGAEAQDKLKELTAANGLTQEMAQQMAQQTPDALLKLLGVEKGEVAPSPVPSSGGVNSAAFDPTPKQQGPKHRAMRANTGKEMVDAWNDVADRVNAELKEQGYL